MSEETINQEPQNDVDAAEAEYSAAFAAALSDDQQPLVAPEAAVVEEEPVEVDATPAAIEPQVAEVETVEQLKARLAEVSAERDKFFHQAKSDAGRVASLQRQIAQPKQEPKHDAAAALAAVDQLKDFAPDAADAIKQSLAHMDAQINQFAERTQQNQQAQVIADYDTQVSKWASDLSKQHPDWQQIDNTPEFGAFMHAHPEKLFYAQNNPLDAAATGRFITEFKTAQAVKQEDIAATKAALAASKKTQLTNAVGISRGTSGQNPDPDDYDSAFKKALKGI